MPRAPKKPPTAPGDPPLTRATQRAARDRKKVTSPVFTKPRAGTSVPRPVHRPGIASTRRAKSAQDIPTTTKRKRTEQEDFPTDMDLSAFKGQTLQRTPVPSRPPPAKKNKPREDLTESSISDLQGPVEAQAPEASVSENPVDEAACSGGVQNKSIQQITHQSTPSPTERARRQANEAGLFKASEILKQRQAKQRGAENDAPQVVDVSKNMTHIESFSDVGSDMTQDNTLEAEHALLQTIKKSKAKQMEHIRDLQSSLHFSPALPKTQYKARESALFQEETRPKDAAHPGLGRGGEDGKDPSPSRPPRDEAVHKQVINPPDLIHEDEFNIPGESIARMRESLANLSQHVQDNAGYLSKEDKFILCTARDDLSQRIQQFCVVRGHLYCAEGKQAHGIKLLSVGKELESKLQQVMQALLMVPGSPEPRRYSSFSSTQVQNRSRLQAAEKTSLEAEASDRVKASKNEYKTAKNKTRHHQPQKDETFRHSQRVGDNLESTKNSHRSTRVEMGKLEERTLPQKTTSLIKPMNSVQKIVEDHTLSNTLEMSLEVRVAQQALFQAQKEYKAALDMSMQRRRDRIASLPELPTQNRGKTTLPHRSASKENSRTQRIIIDPVIEGDIHPKPQEHHSQGLSHH